MLQIKEGKLYGTNYSFALPEGFNFKVNTYSCGKAMEFISYEGDMKIEIYFVDDCNCAKQDLQDVIDDSDFIKMSDFVSVIRGNGTGIGIFFKSKYRNEEHYEERYDFPKNKYGETQLDVDIYLCSDKAKHKRTIYEALKLPSVKTFLESIQYFN